MHSYGFNIHLLLSTIFGNLVPDLCNFPRVTIRLRALRVDETLRFDSLSKFGIYQIDCMPSANEIHGKYMFQLLRYDREINKPVFYVLSEKND